MTEFSGVWAYTPGILGSLFGWDQSMGAMNTVLASQLIENANRAERQKIVMEVANIISSVQHGQAPDAILEAISKESRVIQMNFIALACDNLGIAPLVPIAFLIVIPTYSNPLQVVEF